MKAEPDRRVVIDTNVWLSAFLMKTGAPAVVVRHVVALGQAVFSAQTFAELESRLWLPKFDRYLPMEERRRLLGDVNALAYWVDVPAKIASRKFCRDADDDKFIHAALAAEAPWLVTGDRDLLEAPPVPGLRILTPAAASQLSGFRV